MARILLTHPTPARRLYYGDAAVEGLGVLGELRLNEGNGPLDGMRLINAARGCDIVVSDRTAPGAPELFQSLPDLVAFVRCAVDTRNVDVEAASRAGVLVTRASAGFAPAVAELIIGFMVDLARGITRASGEYRAGRAPKIVMGRQLYGSTLGIIGYGAIGRHLADVGLAFGMRVLVSDPFASVVREGIDRVELDALLTRADFVVCLAVANERTENLIGADALARMKRGAFFVNASRGNLVDEAALAAALDEHRIAGAAIDVGREADQMPSPALAARSDVIATPHVGGLTPEAASHQAHETVRQVAEIVSGRVPPGALNPERATRIARLAR